jgi:hypothetical protein
MAKKLVYTTNTPSASTDYAAADGTWKPYSGGGGGGAGSIIHGTASGTDTYTVTLSGVTSYADGDAYLIRFTNGNTTGCTLNVNSLGAKDLYRNNNGLLIGGDIVDGGEMLCVYNSTLNGFQVIGTAPNTLLAYVTNVNGSTITKGQPVYAFGGQGDRLTVKLASNLTDATSAQTVGIVLSTSIANNQKGLIIVNGQLDGLNIFPTPTWADGDPIYLGATAGTVTNVKPLAPNHLVYLGFVTTASPGASGRMYVRVQNGYEMDEIHDVSAVSPANDDILKYNSTSGLWEKSNVLSTKQDTITLTTTNTSGAATLVGSTLNVPIYAAAGSGTSFLTGTVGNANTSVGAGATNYLGLTGSGLSISENIRVTVLPQNCTLSRLYFTTATTQPATGSLVVTLRKNNADTALVITIAAGSAANFFNNTANSVSFTAGQYASIKVVNNASAASAAVNCVSIMVTI